MHACMHACTIESSCPGKDVAVRKQLRGVGVPEQQVLRKVAAREQRLLREVVLPFGKLHNVPQSAQTSQRGAGSIVGAMDVNSKVLEGL